MSKKTIGVDIRLPQATLDKLSAVAKLAGLSVSSVIKVALATQVRRTQQVPQPPEAQP